MIQKARRFREMDMEPVSLQDQAKKLAEENGELTLLKAMDCILVLAEDSELSEEFWEASRVFTEYMKERMGISPSQAVMLTLLIESGSGGSPASMADMGRYTGCRNVKIMQYQQELDGLLKLGLVRKTERNYRQEMNYVIPKGVFEALRKNEVYVKPAYECSNVMEFFQRFFDLTHLRFEEQMSTELLVEETQELLERNKKLPFVRELQRLEISIENRLVVMHLCRHLVLNGEDCVDIGRIDYLFDDKKTQYDFDRAMVEKKHLLIRMELVEQAFNGGFESDKEFRMTDEARKKLLKGVALTLNEQSRCDILEYKKIRKKELFFGKEVDDHMERLSQLLEEKEFQRICERLKKDGFRDGFTCLFYGAPGTGKTESVMQLARESGRDIMQVNIADVKSKWVGDSEKNIKGIFDHYRYVVENSRKTPILLFNEADAIIGNRKRGAERAVDKMENSIQNIILQEMENLKGIMIATTNLEENMDKAFERRFLYKVKFAKPDNEQRANIWHSMMPTLDKELVGQLASEYDFSGGQIENIARKYRVDCILYGKRAVNTKRLKKYCEEETLGNKVKRIGF